MRVAYKCPVCHRLQKKLTQHIRTVHIKELGSDYHCRLYSNIAKLEGKLKYRGRHYKVCPEKDCGSVIADVVVHLTNVHKLNKDETRTKSFMAMKVTDIKPIQLLEEDENESPIPTQKRRRRIEETDSSVDSDAPKLQDEETSESGSPIPTSSKRRRVDSSDDSSDDSTPAPKTSQRIV